MRPAATAGWWWNRASWMFGFLVLAAVIAVALHLTELERFVELARNSQPAWLFTGLILQSITYFAAAGVWWVASARCDRTDGDSPTSRHDILAADAPRTDTGA